MAIRFTANTNKILEGIVWLADRHPGISFHCALKAMFYADKNHLQKHGRPIFGDLYIKMSFGPVGSTAYDILKGSDFLPDDVLIAVGDAFSVDRASRVPRVHAKRKPNLDFFSTSDIGCLEDALARCASLGFNGRTETTHQERAWVEAVMHGEMDYAKIIDDDLAYRDELIAHLNEVSAAIAF
jgi:uncharacterized phage-associated protein